MTRGSKHTERKKTNKRHEMLDERVLEVESTKKKKICNDETVTQSKGHISKYEKTQEKRRTIIRRLY